ncbi:MAG: hypothetical protein EHM43_05720 [Ignavibacteriae bacterium]|nr:MAG: hypothetical protein EHM43_05720 [Ignavibacteriota bacterium]
MTPLRICFLWHFHQPDYRRGDEFYLPWVYLHTVKDYVDLVKLFQEYPVKHTINVVPSLLLQVDAYLHGRKDPVQQLCERDPDDFTDEDRLQLARWCLTVQTGTMVAPLPRFRELHDRLGDPSTLTPSEILDLQVSLLLSWTGPLHRHDPRIAPLLHRTTFTMDDRTTTQQVHNEILSSMIPTLVEAERSGQIEISVTPFHHPILPLIIDTNVARQSMPNTSLPTVPFKAVDDATWHVESAINDWFARSGRRPRGMWPAEGSVSDDAISLMASAGVAWTATDSDVLRHSLGPEYSPASAYLQYEAGGEAATVTMLFRDHELADAIGFEYAGWDPEAAADDFVRRLEERRRLIIQEFGEDALAYATVPVILDGENCWEFYSENGVPFLRALLSRLADRNRFEVVTCSEAASAAPDRHHRLPHLVAGSWIRGTFDIWIGSAVKNAAWSALGEARQAVRALGDPPDLLERVLRLEASDWFWWYDERHAAPNKADFDHTFREHLRGIFEQAGTTCSLDLRIPIAEAVMQDTKGAVSKSVSFSKQSAMHEADAISSLVTIETDGNWQRVIVHLQRAMLESEEVMVTITDRHHGERCCCVTHDDYMFRSMLHDEGFERLPEGFAIYVHTTTVWFIKIEEQRASGNNVSTVLTFELDLHGAG